MTEEDLIEKLAVYLATERSKMGVYPASQIAREVISMVRERDRQKRALDELIAGDADLYGLSAAPSPMDEDEVERVAEQVIECAVRRLQKLPDHAGRPAWTEIVAEEIRAAISAMRPAPKLTEEWTNDHQTSLVAAVYDAMWHWDEVPMDTDDSISLAEMLKDKLRENGLTLSLIDKLTEAG